MSSFSIPSHAIPISLDGQLLKVIDEPGDPLNFHSSASDTAVAVEYEIYSPQGLVTSTAPDDPVCWVTGDLVSESTVYDFLPICVRTMHEKEQATFYFPRSHFLGEVPFVTLDGRFDESTHLMSHVHLVRARPLSAISFDESPPASKPSPHATVSASTPERFAVNQLLFGERLLSEKKPGLARKEFNRARMAWGKDVDLSKVPADLQHPALSLPPEELRKYVDSRALYGVGRTFLAITPPQKVNAIAKLREALTIDPQCQEVIDLLIELGEKVDDDEFPAFSDARLGTHQFWMQDRVPWEKRLEFATVVRKEGGDHFGRKEYRQALAAYNRAMAAFAGQGMSSLTDDRKQQMFEHLTLNRLNIVACHLEMGQYLECVKDASELMDFLNQNRSTLNAHKIKCLYRKTRAYLKLENEEQAQETVKELMGIPGSENAVQQLRAIINEEKRAQQVEIDAMYRKISTQAAAEPPC